MLDLVRKNFGLKLISVLLAISAWAYLRFAENPIIAARFDQQLSVPIVVTGLRPGFVARLPERQALVMIVTPRGETLPVKPDEVKASVDLSDRDAGVYNVPVAITPAQKLEVKSFTPGSLTLTIERIEERNFSVAVQYVGDRHNLVVDGAQVNPWRATVRGASSDLEKIAAVRVDVPFGEGQFDAMVKPVAADQTGRPVENVVVAPELVRVRAHFDKSEH